MCGNKFGCVRRSSSTKGNNPPNKQMYTHSGAVKFCLLERERENPVP